MNIEEVFKKCMVCGDRAIGNNFDALSCESCKAFFRRNAVKNKPFKCHFDNDCKIDVKTRKYCKKCRIKKCFDIGMKKDWILSDEEKNIRKNKIEMNRRKRKNSFKDSSSDNSDLIIKWTTDSNSDNFGDFDTTLEIPDTYEDSDDMNTQITDFEDLIKMNETNEISDIVYQKAAELEFSIIPIARPLIDCYHFNELEGNKLTELFYAMTIVSDETKPADTRVSTTESMIAVMSSKCEQMIRKVIQMSKRLTAFNGINENDRISLIKYGCMELYAFRLVKSFDYMNGRWTIIMDNKSAIHVNLDLMKPFSRNFYEVYKNFLNKFFKEWDSDSVALDLMTAIVLFNADRPGIMQKEMVKLQQHMYMYLLQRYLQIRYQSQSQSKVKFLQLLNTLLDLNVLGETYLKNCAEKDPKTVSPLLQEIFGIKPKSETNQNINILVF